VIDIDQPWKYSYGALDGQNWAGMDFDDSRWSAPSRGVLWADTRASPNPLIPQKTTRLVTDATTGFPYVTYYFRTTFILTNLPAGRALDFSGYIDDGAAFYINGVKTYLLRLADDASSSTVAIGFPCGGDAVCLDQFTIPPESNTNLVIGTNVLAVEVHNYNVRSPDLTFGIGMSRIEPIPRPLNLTIGSAGQTITLEWSAGAILQSAETVEGSWDDVTPIPASPMILQPSGSSRFYRLRR
jgi:hypothetical protein